MQRAAAIALATMTQLTSSCAPRPFDAAAALARAEATLGPLPPWMSRRELYAHVEGDYALVTVLPVYADNVEVGHGSLLPQVWVARSGETRILDVWAADSVDRVRRSVDPRDTRDSVGVRRVAAALLPPAARIYRVTQSPAEWRPLWLVYALTSDLSVAPPTGLIVTVLDTVAWIDTKFPRAAHEGYRP